MHSIFTVPSITDPYKTGYRHPNSSTRTAVLSNGTTLSSASGNAGANARSLPLSTLAINRLVVAPPYNWT